MACGNNKVSREYLSSQPKTVTGLRTNVNSVSNAARSQKIVPRVFDAFAQQAVAPDKIGKHGAYLSYKANGQIRDARIVRVREADGSFRHISIREKIDKFGRVTDVLAEDGIKTEIRWKDDDPKKGKSVPPKEKSGDHAHLATDADSTGAPAKRDSLGGLLAKLQDLDRTDFQPDLAVLGTTAADFADGRGDPRDVHADPETSS